MLELIFHIFFRYFSYVSPTLSDTILFLISFLFLFLHFFFLPYVRMRIVCLYFGSITFSSSIPCSLLGDSINTFLFFLQAPLSSSYLFLFSFSFSLVLCSSTVFYPCTFCYIPPQFHMIGTEPRAFYFSLS